MHDVSEHDTEEEGEGNDGWHGWVEFFVVGGTISVHDLLENIYEVILLETCWLDQIYAICIDQLKIESFDCLLQLH